MRFSVVPIERIADGWKMPVSLRSTRFVPYAAVTCGAVLLSVGVGCGDDGSGSGGGATSGSTGSETNAAATGSTSTSPTSSSTSTATASSTGTGGGGEGFWTRETGASIFGAESAPDGGLYLIVRGEPADLETTSSAQPANGSGPGFLAKLAADDGSTEWTYPLPFVEPIVERIAVGPDGQVAAPTDPDLNAPYGSIVTVAATGTLDWQFDELNVAWLTPDFDATGRIWAGIMSYTEAGWTQVAPFTFPLSRSAESFASVVGTDALTEPLTFLGLELDATTTRFEVPSTIEDCADCRTEARPLQLTDGTTIMFAALRLTDGTLAPSGTLTWGCPTGQRAGLWAFDDDGGCLWAIPFETFDINLNQTLAPSVDGFLVATTTSVELRSKADGSVVEAWDLPAGTFYGTATAYGPAVHLVEHLPMATRLRRTR